MSNISEHTNIIAKIRQNLIDTTNITDEELKVLNSILFRLWQSDFLKTGSDDE